MDQISRVKKFYASEGHIRLKTFAWIVGKTGQNMLTCLPDDLVVSGWFELFLSNKMRRLTVLAKIDLQMYYNL